MNGAYSTPKDEQGANVDHVQLCQMPFRQTAWAISLCVVEARCILFILAGECDVIFGSAGTKFEQRGV